MPKKYLVIGGVLLLLSLGTAIYIWQRNPLKMTPTSSAPKTQTEAKTQTWDDQAGFTFEYPKDLLVDKHDEDQNNYAHVELTQSAHPGKIIVWAKDLPLTKKGVVVANATEWVNTDSQYPGANILDTTLGGEPAKKILLASGSSGQVIGAVYDNTLWYIEGTLTDKEYWLQVYDGIVKSFSFKPIAGQKTTTSTSKNSASQDAVNEAPADEEVVLE